MVDGLGNGNAGEVGEGDPGKSVANSSGDVGVEGWDMMRGFAEIFLVFINRPRSGPLVGLVPLLLLLEPEVAGVLALRLLLID